MTRPTLRSVPPVSVEARPVTQNPLVLVPIAWGKPDKDLAAAVCRHLVAATPPIIIPANPLTAAKLRDWLTTHHIEQERATCPTISETSRLNKRDECPPATRRKKAARGGSPRRGTEARTVPVDAPISRG